VFAAVVDHAGKSNLALAAAAVAAAPDADKAADLAAAAAAAAAAAGTAVAAGGGEGHGCWTEMIATPHCSPWSLRLLAVLLWWQH